MSNFIEMSEDEWEEKYKPIKNHLNENATWNGWLYETFGEEIEFVMTQPDLKIWTLYEGDGGMCIVSGYHWVNRLGYFITEVAFDLNDEVQVIVDDEIDGEDELVED